MLGAAVSMAGLRDVPISLQFLRDLGSRVIPRCGLTQRERVTCMSSHGDCIDSSCSAPGSFPGLRTL